MQCAEVVNNLAELTLRHIAIGRNYAQFRAMRSDGIPDLCFDGLKDRRHSA